MEKFTRLTFDPNMMGGRACVRGMKFLADMGISPRSVTERKICTI